MPRAPLKMNTKLIVLSLKIDSVFCFSDSVPAIPENITVTFISPTSVKISWQTLLTNQQANKSKVVDKYDITYKPTNAR